MNLCIQNLGWRTPDFARNQSQSGLCVDWHLMFCENDQRRPALIKPGIHPRSDLYPAGKRETNVDAVTHFVCSKRVHDFLDNFFV